MPPTLIKSNLCFLFIEFCARCRQIKISLAEIWDKINKMMLRISGNK